jgi:predicted PurR-regulated permease PerM
MAAAGSVTSLAGVIAVIAIGAAASVTGAVVAPVTCALVLIAVAWPLQKALQQRLGAAVATTVTMLTTLVAVFLLAGMVAWGFSRVTAWLIADAARLQEVFVAQTAWLEEQGIGVAALLADHFDVRWMARAAQQITGAAQGFLSFVVITLVFTLLGLLEVEATARRLARLGPRGEQGVETVRALARKLQVYMAVRTVVSLLTGLGIWAFARLAGLQLAVEWGVIAFAMNYIPFIGPLVATIFPTLFAGLQFGEWRIAIAVFLGMNVIQFVLGSYLEPRMTGRVLSVSPFSVLFAVFFGALIWGVAGAFLGTPILIAVLTMCERSERMRWLAVLLSADDGARVTGALVPRRGPASGALDQNEPAKDPISSTASSASTGPTTTAITRSP